MMKTESSKGVSRRGFIAACGAAVAASAVPAVALGAPAAGEGEWPGAFRQIVERLRPLYMAEVVRLAEMLKPRFEAGELRENVDSDYPDDFAPCPKDFSLDDLPMGRLEAACRQRFGLAVPEEESGTPESIVSASLILAVSPSECQTDLGESDPRPRAVEAAAMDVLAVARERGWCPPAEVLS
jgi:hypothetical protein